MVDLFFDTVIDSPVDNEPVRLSGFGRFRLRDKNERPARNPRTGEVAMVTARRVVTFSASRLLRRRIDEAASVAPVHEDRP